MCRIVIASLTNTRRAAWRIGPRLISSSGVSFHVSSAVSSPVSSRVSSAVSSAVSPGVPFHVSSAVSSPVSSRVSSAVSSLVSAVSSSVSSVVSSPISSSVSSPISYLVLPLSLPPSLVLSLPLPEGICHSGSMLLLPSSWSISTKGSLVPSNDLCRRVVGCICSWGGSPKQLRVLWNRRFCFLETSRFCLSRALAPGGCSCKTNTQALSSHRIFCGTLPRNLARPRRGIDAGQD